MRRESIGCTMLLFVDCSASMGRESIECTMVLFVECSASMRRDSIGCTMLLFGCFHEEGEHWVYNVVVC